MKVVQAKVTEGPTYLYDDMEWEETLDMMEQGLAPSWARSAAHGGFDWNWSVHGNPDSAPDADANANANASASASAHANPNPNPIQPQPHLRCTYDAAYAQYVLGLEEFLPLDSLLPGCSDGHLIDLLENVPRDLPQDAASIMDDVNQEPTTVSPKSGHALPAATATDENVSNAPAAAVAVAVAPAPNATATATTDTAAADDGTVLTATLPAALAPKTPPPAVPEADVPMEDALPPVPHPAPLPDVVSTAVSAGSDIANIAQTDGLLLQPQPVVQNPFLIPLTTGPSAPYLAPAFDEQAAMGNVGIPYDQLPVDDMVDDMDLDPVTGLGQMTEPAEQRMSAFARLKFCDGSYYMHTYQIILGRNLKLAHEDMARLKEAEYWRKRGNEKKAQAALQGRRRRKHGNARSVISETGGIVSAPISSLPAEYQHRRKSVASHSASSSSHQVSHSGSSGQAEDAVEHAPQDIIMQAFPTVPHEVENMVVEDPNDTPIVPIHPQHITETRGHKGPKGISRQHAKIFYNFEESRFDLEVLSPNGLYHERIYHGKGEIIPLHHGDHIIIGMVEITFLLPDIALTEEERARQSSSRPMSFTFENGVGENEEIDSSEGSDQESVNPRHLFYRTEVDEDSDDMLEHEEDDESETPEEPVPQRGPRLKMKLKRPPPPPEPPTKKSTKKKPAPETPPPKVTLKQQKLKQKEVLKEPSRDKVKTALQEAAKEKAEKPEKPDKLEKGKDKLDASPTKEEQPKKPEGEKEPKEFKEPKEPKEKKSEGQGERETVLTWEDVKRLGLPENMVGAAVEKRKGPGRPPKDGLMSKRQKSQMIREFREAEKAKKLGLDPSELPTTITKPKPPRPRKDSNLGEDGDGDIRETTEGKGEGGTEQSGEKKVSKPTRPPRSPSPEMKESDYTEEQLQRPSANYVVLIHEAISSSKTGAMNLQQIYSAIERKYPYYKFRTTTNGWQSSVRHNLGQHDAFKKADKEGKGYNWVIDPEVSIEKERRKRVSPPPQQQAPRPQYYAPHPPYPGPHAPAGQFYGSFYPPPSAPQNGPGPGAPDPHAALPRLPPSLARTAPANVPAPAPPSHASPYASPWAGGAASQSAAANPPRPYPPPAPSTVSNGTGNHATGQYGMLVATSAPFQPYSATTSSHSPYATAGAAHNNPPRPYNPYAKPSPSAPTPSIPAAPSQTAPVAQMAAQPAQPTQPPPQAHQPFPWPSNLKENVLEGAMTFRNTFLQHMSKHPEGQLRVDNALRSVIFKPSDPPLVLTPEEQFIANAFRHAVPAVNNLHNEPPTTQVSQASTTGNVPPPASATSITTAPPAPAPNPSAAGPSLTTAVAVSAASDAAKLTTLSAPLASAPVASAQQNDVNGGANEVPSPHPSTHAQFQRPSVEPLTPVPGSPSLAGRMNGSLAPTSLASGTKRSFAEIERSPSNDAAVAGNESTGEREAKRPALEETVTALASGPKSLFAEVEPRPKNESAPAGNGPIDKPEAKRPALETVAGAIQPEVKAQN